jgi:hypothetical protein
MGRTLLLVADERKRASQPSVLPSSPLEPPPRPSPRLALRIHGRAPEDAARGVVDVRINHNSAFPPASCRCSVAPSVFWLWGPLRVVVEMTEIPRLPWDDHPSASSASHLAKSNPPRPFRSNPPVRTPVPRSHQESSETGREMVTARECPLVPLKKAASLKFAAPPCSRDNERRSLWARSRAAGSRHSQCRVATARTSQGRRSDRCPCRNRRRRSRS